MIEQGRPQTLPKPGLSGREQAGPPPAVGPELEGTRWSGSPAPGEVSSRPLLDTEEPESGGGGMPRGQLPAQSRGCGRDGDGPRNAASAAVPWERLGVKIPEPVHVASPGSDCCVRFCRECRSRREMRAEAVEGEAMGTGCNSPRSDLVLAKIRANHIGKRGRDKAPQTQWFQGTPVSHLADLQAGWRTWLSLGLSRVSAWPRPFPEGLGMGWNHLQAVQVLAEISPRRL